MVKNNKMLVEYRSVRERNGHDVRERTIYMAGNKQIT